MEFIFRQRLDRPDAKGRAGVFVDLHWAGGNRWKVPTGVKCMPSHFTPTKNKRIATGADDAIGANLRLNRLAAAIGGAFLAAEAAGRPEATVTQSELEAAIEAVGGGPRRTKRVAPVEAAPAELSAASPWSAFEARWRAENEHSLSVHTLRRFKQVVTHLEEFEPRLQMATLTRDKLQQYTAWLYGQGKLDSTVNRHYTFLRECHRLLGLAVPRWLGKLTVRYGRRPTLQRAEVLAIMAAELPPDLAEERDVFLLQLLLLLRDVDLRALRPHHVTPRDLPGFGPTLCVDLYQAKTGEPVVIPLPPAAVTIWQAYGGELPMPSQQERNRRLKLLGRVAGLKREFVETSFSGKARREEVLPLYKVITTHTARHSGAALLVWASGGDQALKEIALGHVSASVYGHDTLERYGPQLLRAWASALGEAAEAGASQPGARMEIAPGF